MRHPHQGFTLVEIAIVLVIIGLLLGGVLKGQELINNAKVKNFINDFRTTSTFVYTYQDRFRALPGDDANAAAHLNNASVADNTARLLGNGRINGNWNSESTTEESYLFWQHVRLAGLATGSTTPGNSAYLPRNADGGRIGITGDAVATGGSGWSAAFFVCSSGILGRHARQIDTTMDDGNTATGAVRVLGQGEISATSAALPNLTAAEDGNSYTVCVAY